MGVFSQIFKRPRPNQSWNGDKIVTHHEEETWLQLFIDLIFVAFFMTLGKGIYYCEGYEQEHADKVLGAAGLLFVMIFGLRYDIDVYANRFHSRDLVTRVLYFLYTCGLVVLSLHIYKTDSSDACPFLGLQNKAVIAGFLVAYGSIVVLNAVAIFHNPKSQPQLGLEFFFSVLYLIFALIVVGPIPDDSVIDFFRVTVPLNYILRTECLGQFIRPIFNKYLGPYVFVGNYGSLEFERDFIPLNVHVHQVRLCMFIMIATGEGMIQIIYPSLPAHSNYMDRIYFFVISCVVILFSIAMIYADAVIRDVHHQDHALVRDQKVSGTFWTFSHAILGYLIFLVGIDIEMAIVSVYANEPIDHSYDALLGTCLGSATLLMTAMRASHKGLSPEENDEYGKLVGWGNVLRRKMNYAFRIAFSFLHFFLAYLEHFTRDIESDDPSETGGYEGISAAGDSSTDSVNYHNVRAKDVFFYCHASVLALSLILEVTASFLCKKKIRTVRSQTLSVGSPMQAADNIVNEKL